MNKQFLKQFTAHISGTKLNVLVSLATLIMCFIIADLYFRYTGNYLSYSEKQGQAYASPFKNKMKYWYFTYTPNSTLVDTCPEFCYRYRSNKDGLFDSVFETAKVKGAIRVIVLGDSFIQGIGTPGDSSCPKQLEKLLAKAEKWLPPVEVWNCGNAGSDPFFEYMLLANKLLKYRPEVVVVGLNSSDIGDVMTRGGFERFKSDSTVSFKSGPWFEPFYAHSFIVRRIVHDVYNYNWAFQKPEEQIPAHKKSMELLISSILAFQKLCAANEIKLIVAVQPLRGELDGTCTYDMQQIIQFCQASNINSVDVRACLRGKGYTSSSVASLYWPINGHFNGLGYYQYAQCLIEPLSVCIESIKNHRI